ncbi:MAG: hypothetical protein AB7I04_22470 [Pseudomonadales bacterium]
MGVAPGYSPWLPHDLQHLIVEKALNLKAGVFGQIEAGGTANTFHALDEGGSKREKSRRRRSLKKKGQSLASAGQADAARSERATIVCLYHWMKSSGRPEVRAEAGGIRDVAISTLEGMPAAERDTYSSEMLDKVAKEMERLSREWQQTGVGESLEVPW